MGVLVGNPQCFISNSNGDILDFWLQKLNGLLSYGILIFAQILNA